MKVKKQGSKRKVAAAEGGDDDGDDDDFQFGDAKRGNGRHSQCARGILNEWLWAHFYPTEVRQKPVPTRQEKKGGGGTSLIQLTHIALNRRLVSTLEPIK
jgi:hypothetical protein